MEHKLPYKPGLCPRLSTRSSYVFGFGMAFEVAGTLNNACPIASVSGRSWGVFLCRYYKEFKCRRDRQLHYDDGQWSSADSISSAYLVRPAGQTTLSFWWRMRVSMRRENFFSWGLHVPHSPRRFWYLITAAQYSRNQGSAIWLFLATTDSSCV